MLEMIGQNKSDHTGEAKAWVLCQLSFLNNWEHKVSHLSYLMTCFVKWQEDAEMEGCAQ